ncbi:hypothetical protein DSCW_24630 [Desulfosarcina widdelii]|uniref:Uncharacterized protein n=1 Tax=Desulfosarcina widdelii TaxID=947919 RepID=A0A5K7Z046_9BACT|nr:hypothetical protein [Desulfosarcina widdelii]BBO75046.1 hypothetical protein DSCW_24630 [Desulfosarcina widdelii]
MAVPYEKGFFSVLDRLSLMKLPALNHSHHDCKCLTPRRQGNRIVNCGFFAVKKLKMHIVNNDETVKVRSSHHFVIPAQAGARSEALALSSLFNTFWMPDQVRHDESGTFYETANNKKEI